MKIFVPGSTYENGMDFSEGESVNLILSHSVVGLVTRGLLAIDYWWGPKEALVSSYKDADSEGIIVTPSSLGARLFLHAYGLNDVLENDFTASKIPIEPFKNFSIPKGARRVQIRG